MGEFQKLFSKVTEYKKQLQGAVKVINDAQYKKVGTYQIAISDQEKEMMLQEVHDLFNKKIDSVYQEINEKLKAVGEKPLVNPYKKG